jgi:hypothetical protein
VSTNTTEDAVSTPEPEPSAEEQFKAFELRMPRSVSIGQAAYLLCLSRRTVYNRIRDGRLATIRGNDGSQRVLVRSLFEYGFQPQVCPTSASAATFDVRPVTR